MKAKSTHRALCANGGKRAYRSRAAALRASLEFIGVYGAIYDAYRCHACSRWHLTTALRASEVRA